MAAFIELPNLRDGYVSLVEHVVRTGRQTAPRGQPTLEVNDVTFTVSDLSDTLPIGVGRDLNTVVAALEALQLIGEISTPSLLVAASSQFANYREDDGQFWGAYGLRVGTQVSSVVDKLVSDAQTRQAVVTLWNPAMDNVPGKRDYPCTVALGFRLVDDRLDMSVLMRSNDVWLGVAYDVFVFTQLQWTLARWLEVEPGTYTHTAWSLHIYERDVPKVARLRRRTDEGPPLPRGLTSGDHDRGYVELAREVLLRPQDVVAQDDDLRWYVDRSLKVHEERS